MTKFIYLIVGGSVGAVSRYFFSGLIHRIFGENFPYGTLAVNLAGCFIMGLLAGVVEKKLLIDSNLRMVLMIGFCGAFTTFSTFMFETDSLIRDGEMLRASVNILISVVGAFIVFRLGSLLGDVL